MVWQYNGLRFSKVAEPGVLEARSGNRMSLSFPKVSQPGSSEAYFGPLAVLWH